jgi:hypothetical protein
MRSDADENQWKQVLVSKLDGRNVLGMLRASRVSQTPNSGQAQTAMEGNMEGYAALDFEGIRCSIKSGDPSDQIIQYK